MGLAGRELLRLLREVGRAAAGMLALERQAERAADFEAKLEEHEEVDDWLLEIAKRQREGIALGELRQRTEPAQIEAREERAFRGVRQTPAFDWACPCGFQAPMVTPQHAGCDPPIHRAPS